MAEAGTLPIRRLTLYKHGVGFVQREGTLGGEEVRLAFRAAEVNDALKSLLVIDRGGGSVFGIHYDTPADREARLADCPIRLDENASMLDLLRGMRGWRVRLARGEGTRTQEITGRLLGIDLLNHQAENPPDPLVALQDEATGAVVAVRFADLVSVYLLEERAGQDLDFFLNTSRGEDAHRRITVRLSPGEHDLAISYLVPSPTWRVSYRLVAETDEGADAAAGSGGALLLQGWGLFDNRLEEDLTDVAVTLVAGQPISFIYDLATSHIPQRPLIADTARVATAPVEFEGAIPAAPAGVPEQSVPLFSRRLAPAPMAAMAPPAPAPAATIAALQDQATTAVAGDLGELFAYRVMAPVSVRRGESALVPILSERIPYRRELLFNERKLPAHPVAALRFGNSTGLVLERGPVTVLEDGEYRGEALVPFSKEGAEVYLAFAVELGITVRVVRENATEVAGLTIANALLEVKQANLTRTVYRLESALRAAQVVTIEHPVDPFSTLVDTPEPIARVGDWYRWTLTCEPRATAAFTVIQRRFTHRSEKLLDQSYAALQAYLRDRWLDQAAYEQIRALLEERSAIAEHERVAANLDAERTQIYGREEQLRKNMAALSGEGDEGALRRQAVEKLGTCEERIAAIDGRLAEIAADSARRQAAIDAELARLKLHRDVRAD